ncbi:MAG: hypothetical protein C0625_04615 [Arcobacter sp.]|nr:MAG: hypothetical protein C0625_04615 [Arcobacter sp.]
MRILLYGFVIGLIMPIIGMLLFLQFSQAVGDTLLIPMYILAGIFEEPFWYLSLGQKAVLFALCGIFYSFFIGCLQVSPNKN